MKTIFRYRLLRLRGQILGWGIALAVYGIFIVQFYDTIFEQQEQFEQLLESYPKGLMAFFGDMDQFFTPSGYLDTYFFSYMSLILAIFAVLMGSGLLASDEENGRLDLILAHPISRAALFWGRLSVLIVATVAILVIAWLGLAVPVNWTSLSVNWVEMALPFLPLLAVLILFSMLALLLSMLLPSRRLAAMTSGLAFVANYFLTALMRINPDIEPIVQLSPLYYYQGGEAVNGLDIPKLVGLLVVAAVLALLAWWRFQRRDVRVGGEGGWKWPPLRSLLRQVLTRRETLAPERAAAQRYTERI